jgi:hypothetical protein
MPNARRMSDIQTIRSLMPLILIGLTFVVSALLLLKWPNGQFGEENVSPLPHLERIGQPLIGESSLSLPRRILDIAIYVVVVVGLGFLVLTWRRGQRNSLLGLIGVSILGLSYVSGMALYAGPAVGTCGFLLIFFGAMVAWVSADSEDETDGIKSDDLTRESIDRTPDSADRTDNAT